MLYILGTNEVNILHYLGSTELQRLLQSFEASPDVAKVVLHTVLQALYDRNVVSGNGSLLVLKKVKNKHHGGFKVDFGFSN